MRDTILCIAIIVGSFCAGRYLIRIEFDTEQAKIQQLRTDVELVGLGENEAILGQATAWNQEIRSIQVRRRKPFVRWFFDSRWDTVSVIDLAPVYNDTTSYPISP